MTLSGVFLLIINLVILVGILKVFREMRRGKYDEQALEEQLNNRGVLNRILGRFTRAVRKPCHMYPVGLLFGLGFDTATEVGLQNGPLHAVASLDLNYVGYGIVALFVLTWIAAAAVWRLGRIEEKWSSGLRHHGPAS